MAQDAWWGPMVQWGAWLAIMTLVMGWLGRTRMRPRPDAEAGRLVQPYSTLVLGLVCCGLFAALAIITNVYANETTTWWTTALFVGFAALSLSFVVGYFTDKHHVTKEDLVYAPVFGFRPRRMQWRDVTTLGYSHFMKWFWIRSADGQVARLSVMLMGLPTFARMALMHAPEGAIDADTREILKLTSDGRPPSVWV